MQLLKSLRRSNGIHYRYYRRYTSPPRFKKVKLPPLPKELGDDRVEELEGKLDDLEKREKELKEDGAEDLKPDQVEDYWNE